MIKVQFFAGIREAVGTAAVDLDYDPEIRKVMDVVDRLCEQQPSWQTALKNEKVLVALNQEMTQFNASVLDGDEVALFPPVTGG